MRRIKVVVGKFYVWCFYKSILVRNRVKSFILPAIDHKFLFLLCPPFSGSTMLNELISSSHNVSCNNLRSTREGQQLPGVRKIIWESGEGWNEDAVFDWQYIKSIWLRYWDATKPVLLEKSPSNIVRTNTLEAYFTPAYFICMVRNPYALAEGFIRRSKVNYRPKDAAEFVVKCFKYQKSNLESLKNVLLLTYEEITNNKDTIKYALANFLAELSDLDVNIEARAHSIRGEPMQITNLNKEKIERLSDDEFKQINKVFVENEMLLKYFGYRVFMSKEDMLSETLV